MSSKKKVDVLDKVTSKYGTGEWVIPAGKVHEVRLIKELSEEVMRLRALVSEMDTRKQTVEQAQRDVRYAELRVKWAEEAQEEAETERKHAVEALKTFKREYNTKLNKFMDAMQLPRD